MLVARRRMLHNAASTEFASGPVAVEEGLGKLAHSFQTVNDAAASLSERFIERMRSAYPAAQSELPADSTAAAPELLAAVALVVAHRRDPATTRAELQALGRRHAAQGLRPPHYRLICEQLVRSIADLCGSEWDAELECEWTSSLNLGAAAMIEGATAGDGAGKPAS